MLGLAVVAILVTLAEPDPVTRSRADVERIRAEHFAAAAYQDEVFERLPPARPGDWLHSRPEFGQTFEELLAYKQILPTATAERVVIQPLEPLTDSDRFVLEALRAHAAAFFACEAVLAPPLDPGPERAGQGNARAIIDLLAQRRPHALAYTAVTSRDLTIPGLNFVFGLGDARLATTVCSLARFDGDLGRAKKILVHETGHALGMFHCIYYRCIMNGCNSLAELDATPDDLCPMCLRKLAHGRTIDLAKRYDALGDARRAAWLRARGVNRFW